MDVTICKYTGDGTPKYVTDKGVSRESYFRFQLPSKINQNEVDIYIYFDGQEINAVLNIDNKEQRLFNFFLINFIINIIIFCFSIEEFPLALILKIKK